MWDVSGAGVEASAVPVSLSTTASGSVAAGGQVSDVAHLTLGTNPTGTISFTLYSDVGCTSSVFTSSATVDHGNGDYASGNFTAAQAAGHHRRGAYSGGPPNNPPAAPGGGRRRGGEESRRRWPPDPQ